MISTLCWVRKGTAQPMPAFGDDIFDEEEHMATQKDDEDDDDDDDDDDDEAPKIQFAPGMDVEDPVVRKYNIEAYDNEDDEPGLASINREVQEIIEHNKGGSDPYIKEEALQQIADEELDDLLIRPTDSILLTGVTEEDEFSHLDVHVYEEAERNLYTHHDVMLPSFPLALEWINYYPGQASAQATSTSSSSSSAAPVQKGNCVAIGTFQQHIEIWDLDVIDNLEPLMVLGQPPMLPTQGNKKKNKKNKKQKNKRIDGHTDAIMSLSWNRTQRNLLASGSADQTIRLWDLDTQQTLAILRHHRDKVQCVRWHPIEPSLIASASYDRRVCVLDVRNPNEVRSFTLPEDPECMLWHPHSPAHLLVSTESGRVIVFDATKSDDQPALVLEAHNKAISSMDLNPNVPGLLITVSVDKTLKIWDLLPSTPVLLHSEAVAEQLFSVAWNPDIPFLFAVGGKGTLRTISALKFDGVHRKFNPEAAAEEATQ